jgi:hypothetical protein
LQQERLKADNLALQIVLLPRRVGIIGINGPAKAQEWFAGIEAFPGTDVFIQFAPDPEAKNLANEIAIAVLNRGGWKPQFIDDTRSHVPNDSLHEGVDVLYPTGKPWTAEQSDQPWIRWARATEVLANALTRAGLGVGPYPVLRGGFPNTPPDPRFGPSAMSPYFDPPLTGVYVQVGPRPVASTAEWIRSGRPDAAGNLPAPTAPK